MDKATLLLIDPAAQHSTLDLDVLAGLLTLDLSTNGINTQFRKAAFISQVAIESWHFTRLSENLNYSAEALIKTWPTHFDITNAEAYAHNAEKIANRAYANRMGNGSEESGDGYRYRGRGFIQLTGAYMYQQFAKADCNNAVGNPDLLLQPEFAVRSAIWFWNAHDLSHKADFEDISYITQTVNGGTSDLSTRRAMYEKAKTCLPA